MNPSYELRTYLIFFDKKNFVSSLRISDILGLTIVNFWVIIRYMICAGVVKQVDALDSKSSGPEGPCRFDSDHRHQSKPLILLDL